MTDVREAIEKLSRAKADDQAPDPDRARRQLYDRLAASDESMLREIGEQLRDGVLSPGRLLTIPGYREVVEEGLGRWQAANEALDDEAIRDELVRMVDERVRAQEHRG
jgi:hypothetical protein